MENNETNPSLLAGENETALNETAKETAENAISEESEAPEASEVSETAEESEESESTESSEEPEEASEEDAAPVKKCACSLCGKGFESADPDVLAIGGYGTPRYLCPDCAAALDRASLARDPDEIEEAIREIGETFAEAGCDDEITLDAVNDCLSRANERKLKIEEGTYDFAEDEQGDGFELDEIPEELRESEEDAELDRAEEEAAKKADKIMGIVAAVAVGIAVVYAILKFIVFR